MELNYLGILAAAIAAWVAGSIWYGVLSKPWIAALGWTQADVTGPDGKRRMPIVPMITSFIAELIMATGLAGLMEHLGGLQLEIGVVTGAACWLAFVITTQAVNNGFQKRSVALTIIDGGHWLVVLVLEGAVLGFMGP
jgi:hypothetical protein